MASCRESFEHPFHLAIVRYSHETVTLLRQKLRLTPNMVTLLSLAFGLLALWMLATRRFVAFATCSLLSFYFDALDGTMARRYRLFSPYGEALDHISDAAFFFGIVAVLIFAFGALRRRPVLLALYVLSSLIPAVQYSAAQRACGTGFSGVNGLVGKILVPDDADKAARLAKFLLPFGGATYELFLVLAAIVIALACDVPVRRKPMTRSR